MNFEISPKEYETELNWHEANFYCSMLDIDGYGWRLPTKTELNEIYKMNNDFEKYWYWSGTEHNSIYVWGQYFGNGEQYYDIKYDSSFIRAIRDLCNLK